MMRTVEKLFRANDYKMRQL